MSFLDLTNTPVSSNELLPDGIYLTKIAKSELKDTKSGTGQYLNIQFKVIDGQYEGKSIFNTYNVKNDNATAVKIGMEQLKSLLFHAGAPFTLSAPSDIEGFDVVLKVGNKSDSYGDKNIIKGYTTKAMLETSLKTGDTSGQNIPFKECFKCKESKPLSSFYKHKQMADGLLGKCIQCTKKDVCDNRKNNIDKIRKYDRDRGSRQSLDYVRRYRKRYPKKEKAIALVNYAVISGKIKKQEHCSCCGSSSERIYGHHDDYDLPLVVRWMCQACHKQWHAINGPGKNGE